VVLLQRRADLAQAKLRRRHLAVPAFLQRDIARIDNIPLRGVAANNAVRTDSHLQLRRRTLIVELEFVAVFCAKQGFNLRQSHSQSPS